MLAITPHIHIFEFLLYINNILHVISAVTGAGRARAARAGAGRPAPAGRRGSSHSNHQMAGREMVQPVPVRVEFRCPRGEKPKSPPRTSGGNEAEKVRIPGRGIGLQLLNRRPGASPVAATQRSLLHVIRHSQSSLLCHPQPPCYLVTSAHLLTTLDWFISQGCIGQKHKKKST